MTYYKAPITLFFLLSVVTATAFGQSAARTLVKSFNLLGQDQVTLDLDGPVEVQSWAHKTVRVQMEISLSNRPDSFLKGMITAGRYNLQSDLDETGLVISQPGLHKTVRLKTGVLQENISFIVFAPENVHINVQNAASSATNSLNSEGSK